MALPYDFREIEDRWRQRWDDTGLGRLDHDRIDPSPVFYNLVEFPYPSAEGLHVGHVFKYSGADAYGRFQRMRGRPVFQPIGFDSFGIHTENFAIRRNQHPAVLTGRTTEAFRAQLSRAGLAWDWTHSLDTSQPSYYRWTQWILTRLFRAGLMYQAEAPVVWCPGCLTVLAREQTESQDGVTRCERCSAPHHRAKNASVVSPHHGLRRPAPGRPGRARLAGKGQEAPATVDRALRGARNRLR